MHALPPPALRHRWVLASSAAGASSPPTPHAGAYLLCRPLLLVCLQPLLDVIKLRLQAGTEEVESIRKVQAYI